MVHAKGQHAKRRWERREHHFRMDCLAYAERSDAVLRTAMPGNDGKNERERIGSRTSTDAMEYSAGTIGPRAAPPIREAHIYRRSTAVLAKGTRTRPRLSLRPCFLGRGLSVEWALPIPACPEVQRCTSRPGPSAEGLMPKAARERVANPRAAPPSPCNPACIRAASDEARFEPICN